MNRRAWFARLLRPRPQSTGKDEALFSPADLRPSSPETTAAFLRRIERQAQSPNTTRPERRRERT